MQPIDADLAYREHEGWTTMLNDLLAWGLRLGGALLLMLMMGAATAAPLMFQTTPRSKSVVAGDRLKSLAAHSAAVRFDQETLFQMRPGDEVIVNLPNALAYTAVLEKVTRHASGNRSWVGYLAEHGRDFRVIATASPNGTYGVILTPQGEFNIAPGEGGDLLIDSTSLQMTLPLERNLIDWREPRPEQLMGPSIGPKVDPVCPEITTRPANVATIDVMFVYAPDWEAAHGAANLTARLDFLITRINQVYVDSNIAMQLRRVHAVRVEYGAATAVSDNTALDEITEDPSRGFRGAGVFANIVDLRNQFGADMVAFMRGRTNGGGISGLAWVGGAGQRDIALSANQMYSINGDAPGFGGLLVAHELGHNMGSMHDRPNAGSNNGVVSIGATSYSYGHVVCGTGAEAQCGLAAGFWNTGNGFGTVMAYPRPTVGKFSGPNLTCRGTLASSVDLPCGVPAGQAGAADNSRALNCVRDKLANMRPTGGNANSPATFQFSQASALVAVGAGPTSFTVTRAGSSTSAVSVDFATANDTAIAGTDFDALTGRLSFAAGETSKTLTVNIRNSGATAARSFRVVLSNPLGPNGGSVGAVGTVTVTIRPTGVFPPNGQLPAGWVQGIASQASWVVATDQASEGIFSLKSAPISDNQTASIQFTGTFNAGNISFARRVSSELNFDVFRFFIDNVEQVNVRASGESDWTTVTVPIAAGNRTIRFSYTKDENTIGGSDAAWIDALTLPVPSTPCTANPNGDDDSDGIPNCVEVSEGRNPTVKDNDVFTSSRLFVMQLHRDVLGREASAAEVTQWVATVDTQGRASVLATFLGSADVANIDAPMVRLYAATYLRIPDVGGLQFWTGEFRSQRRSLLNIATEFATAPEFVQRYGTLNNRDFVNRLYINILGRTADQGGSDFWTGRIDRNEETRGSMLMQFSESPEYKTLTARSTTATLLYTSLLRRAPSTTEQTALVNALNGGQTLASQVTSLVLNAPAYRSRFLP
jgi:Domain of unknown function (DUF4214)/Metallo-peptidase family M12B Reprolysin-like/Calx-beta domain